MSVASDIDKGKYDNDAVLFKKELLEEYNLQGHPKKDLLFSKAYMFACKYMPAHHPMDRPIYDRKRLVATEYFFSELSELLY